MGRKGKGSKATLDKLNQKLDDLLATRNVLKARLYEVDRNIALTRLKQVEVTANSSMPCPIRTLPGELIADILETCHSTLSEKNKFYFPVHVSLVSKQWRSLVQSTSSLWATIRASPAHLNRLVNYLQYSGAQPLDITFIGKCAHGELRITTALGMLVSKIKQWRRLHIYTDGGRVFGMMIPQLLDAPAHRLEIFSVSLLGDGMYTQGRYAFHMDALRLHTVHLSKSPIDCRKSAFFRGLRVLRLEGPVADGLPPLSSTDLQAVLAASPQLRELAVELPIRPPQLTDPPLATIELPALRSLEVSCRSPDQRIPNANTVFWVLFAPSLEVFTLTRLGSQSWTAFLRSLFVEPQPRYARVRDLKLNSVRIHGDITGYGHREGENGRIGVRFIDSFPSLKHLQCRDTDVTRIVRTLSYHLECGQCSWPELEGLTVDKCDFSALLTFVRLRAQCQKPLSLVQLPIVYRQLRDTSVEAIEEYTRVKYYRLEDDQEEYDYSFGSGDD
ncbi:hypothetical protein GLOTRDRAFT_123944 [Gloeophyllum trabeum ATCC 11539]|uniref:Uncharacterized protein n=1 Tax=Gloeophyllum trabeum (strain ATCC 11539 / FP-39264 / Madison 617) TaxID=670483 RepID=S7QLG1_GLOTA|nr:uncharacterized protein GLOTRDRAFT_123944 [Gloeophyllum trabeum ATCC 11539]EPQ60187.1 hypothetical protein GLOTRDRAFT_123944 [Gloeophyllum trabeum ATCC 11539]